MFINNIFNSCSEDSILATTIGTNYSIHNNLFYNNGTDANGVTLGYGNVTGSDPLFVDPTATPPDFTLSSGSPALLAGIELGVNIGLADSDYKVNIGVDQDDNATASTTTVILTPNKNGGKQ